MFFLTGGAELVQGNSTTQVGKLFSVFIFRMADVGPLETNIHLLEALNTCRDVST